MSIIICPAADISAPESGNTVTGDVLMDDIICTVIVGAGSALSPVMLYNCMCGVTTGKWHWLQVESCY